MSSSVKPLNFSRSDWLICWYVDYHYYKWICSPGSAPAVIITITTYDDDDNNNDIDDDKNNKWKWS